MNKQVMLLFLVLLIPMCTAWSGDTHKFISTAVLSEKFPGCTYSIKDGAVYPDSTIKDFINHHCENDSADCRARQKAAEWLSKNFSDECNHAFNLAVASHYFADSYTPAHWYSLGDCHSSFESCVEKNIESGRKCWKCTLDCKDNEGIQRNFIVNKSYLMQTANKIALDMNLSAPFSDTRDCDISFLDKIIDFFNNLLRKL
jgi:hypothetical protein